MGVNGKEIVAATLVPGIATWLLALTDRSIDPEMAAVLGFGMGVTGMLVGCFWLALKRNISRN